MPVQGGGGGSRPQFGGGLIAYADTDTAGGVLLPAGPFGKVAETECAQYAAGTGAKRDPDHGR